ncbi:hypothetical protein BN135_1464 [Cronobacter muytjensii 530]
MEIRLDIQIKHLFPRVAVNRARLQFRHNQIMISQHQQRLDQRASLLSGRHQQRGFRRYLIGNVDSLTGQHYKAGDVLRLVREIALQHLQAIQRAARLAAECGDIWRIRMRHFLPGRGGAFAIFDFPVRVALEELAALLEWLRVTVDGFDFLKRGGGGDQHAVVDRQRQLADNRQAGVLQQVIDVVNGARTCVLNRHHGVVRLASFDLVENIVEFGASAFDKLIEMAGGVLTGGKVRVRAFWAEERDAGRVRVRLVQMLLEERLLGENGIFDDELKQPGDVMRVKMMGFPEINQPLQQIAFTVDIPDRTMGGELRFSHLNRQRPALRQQGE